nr:unnamed protein product [Callosobruchus analis]
MFCMTRYTQHPFRDNESGELASEEHGIPFGTLYNKYHGRNIRKPGAQTVFSEKEGECILKSVARCAEWGSPVWIGYTSLSKRSKIPRKDNEFFKKLYYCYGLWFCKCFPVYTYMRLGRRGRHAAHHAVTDHVALKDRDWFTHAKRLPGRKVLIGDNFSTHLDDEVIKLCRENEIDFVCLIPITPLIYVSLLTITDLQLYPMTPFRIYFLKMDRLVPKPCSQYKDILSRIKRNLTSGFCAIGIYPFNKEKLLSRLASEDKDCNGEEIDSTLTASLDEQRYGSNPMEHTRRKKRLVFAPGKSISTNAGTYGEQAFEQDENG